MCTNLVDLHVNSEDGPPEPMTLDKSNAFAYRPRRPHNPLDLTILIRLFQKNLNLRILGLHGHMLSRPKLSSISQLFKAIPTAVESLIITSHYKVAYTEPGEASATELEERDRELPMLGINRIEFQGILPDERLLIPLIKRCQNLQTLVFTAVDTSLSREFCLVFRDHCLQLRELQLVSTSRYFNTDSHISFLIEANTRGWRSIYITFLDDFGPLSETALLRTAPTLEILYVIACPGLVSSTIQKLLCSAPNLERLDALRAFYCSNQPELDAQDIIQSQWVCDRLEALKIKITGVPRPDLHIRNNKQPLSGPLHEGQMEDSLSIQHMVYAQLGALTNLKELILGPDYRDNFQTRELREFYEKEHMERWRHYECLSFTLESGMDQLQHLKSLKRLHLHGMSVGFDGAAEQIWVKDNWPALKYAYGDWNKHDKTRWTEDEYFRAD